MPRRTACISLLLEAYGVAQSYMAPAGLRPSHQHPGIAILPGGRIIQPAGESHITGAGPFGLAVSPSGKVVVTADSGPGVNSLTILEQEKTGKWTGQRMQ